MKYQEYVLTEDPNNYECGVVFFLLFITLSWSALDVSFTGDVAKVGLALPTPKDRQEAYEELLRIG